MEQSASTPARVVAHSSVAAPHPGSGLIMCFFPKHQTQVEVIHNASVMGAVASCGLQLYNFGQTVSIPLWNENWEPDSFHEKIKVNKAVRDMFGCPIACLSAVRRPLTCSIGCSLRRLLL